MTDTPESFAPFAGVALFPREYTDLTSTAQCPACFRALASVVCGHCGLDLGHPVAADLADVSADIAARLDARLELIGRIRYDTGRERARIVEAAQRVAAAPAFESVLAAPPEQNAPPAAPVAAPVVPAATTPLPPAAAAVRRRPTVQVALLVVGISLLSIAAVFFLVYAFITYGIVWRSVIIGSITVAAFVSATLLRRRDLAATAEGIGAFAVVLLYLDVFAVRANDLFGAASADGLVYWGAALALSAFLLGGWHRASGLRVGNVAAFAVFAPGVGLVTAGLASTLDTPARVFAAFLAVGLAGLVHPLARDRSTDATADAPPTVERVTALALAALGVVAAFLTAFAIDFDDATGIPAALALVSLVCAAHVAVALRDRPRSALAGRAAAGFAAVGTVAVSLAAAILAYRTLLVEVAVGAALVATIAVALGAIYLAHRPSSKPATVAARASAVSATAVAGIALLVPLGLALYTALPVPVLATDDRFWTLAAGDPVARPEPVAYGAVAGLVVALAVVAAFFAATRLYPRLRPVLGWSAVALALLAVPLLSVLWAVVAGWLLLAVAAVVVALVTPLARAPFARRLPVLVGGAAAALLGFCTAWAGESTWAPALLAAIALLLAARTVPVPHPVPVRAAMLGLAAVVALMGASAGGRQFGPADDGDYTQWWLVAALAVGVVALAAVSSSRLFSSADRHTLFTIGAPVALVAVPLAGWTSAPAGESGSAPAPAMTLALGLALVGALAAWVIPPAGRSLRPERRIAVAALAPALAFTIAATIELAGLGAEAAPLALPAAGVIAAAGTLAVVVRRGAGEPAVERGPGDLGVALVAVPGLIVAVAVDAELLWLVLLLGAVTALLAATSSEGLVAQSSPRRHLGWVALALGTASLWWSLATASVTTIEAYVLPVAGALLLVALLVWRAGRSSAVPPLLVLAALLVAVVPPAVVAGWAEADEPSVRAFVVAALAAALLLGGSILRAPAALRPYLDAAAAAGAAGLIVVVAGRTVAAVRPDGVGVDGGVGGAAADIWVAAGVTVLALAALGQASSRAGDRADLTAAALPAFGTRSVARTIMVAGVALGGLAETALVREGPAGEIRAVVSVAVFAAVYVLCFALDRTPFDRVAGWAAVGAAGVVAATAVTTGVVDTVEVVTVPLAAALVAVGALSLARDRTVRSWAVLGIPLAVLFVPPLLATTVDRPVWRLVAIGVVAVAAIVVGALRRLQAPFVVGVVVALVHGVATFAPQLRSVYQATEWWVWLGIGGVVVTALSLRYERSLRAAKDVVAGIGGLR